MAFECNIHTHTQVVNIIRFCCLPPPPTKQQIQQARTDTNKREREIVSQVRAYNPSPFHLHFSIDLLQPYVKAYIPKRKNTR